MPIAIRRPLLSSCAASCPRTHPPYVKRFAAICPAKSRLVRELLQPFQVALVEPVAYQFQLTGQFVRDLVSWHGGTFKSGHDSFCPMNTGVASVYCETWLPHSWSPPDKCLGTVSGKSDSNEKRN